MPIYRVELKYAVTMVKLKISSGNQNPGSQSTAIAGGSYLHHYPFLHFLCMVGLLVQLKKPWVLTKMWYPFPACTRIV